MLKKMEIISSKRNLPDNPVKDNPVIVREVYLQNWSPGLIFFIW